MFKDLRKKDGHIEWTYGKSQQRNKTYLKVPNWNLRSRRGNGKNILWMTLVSYGNTQTKGQCPGKQIYKNYLIGKTEKVN